LPLSYKYPDAKQNLTQNVDSNSFQLSKSRYWGSCKDNKAPLYHNVYLHNVLTRLLTISSYIHWK